MSGSERHLLTRDEATLQLSSLCTGHYHGPSHWYEWGGERKNGEMRGKKKEKEKKKKASSRKWENERGKGKERAKETEREKGKRKGKVKVEEGKREEKGKQ